VDLRLLGTLSTVPLGWFTARDFEQVKRVVQNDTLSLHYLVTHVVPDAVAAVVAPVAVGGPRFGMPAGLVHNRCIPLQKNKFESHSIGGSARVDARGSGGVLQLDTVTPRIRRGLHPAPVQPLSTQTQPLRRPSPG